MDIRPPEYEDRVESILDFGLLIYATYGVCPLNAENTHDLGDKNNFFNDCYLFIFLYLITVRSRL